MRCYAKSCGVLRVYDILQYYVIRVIPPPAMARGLICPIGAHLLFFDGPLVGSE